MTRPNPARAAALNRLVEAVGAYHEAFIRPGHSFPLLAQAVVDSRLRDLRAAYEALQAIPVTLPTEAKTRKTAPLTAHWAGMAMSGGVKSMAARIVTHLRYGNATVEELTRALHGKHQTVSARVNELRDAGWVYAQGDTRRTSSGRQAEVYRLTDAGRRCFAEARQLTQETEP